MSLLGTKTQSKISGLSNFRRTARLGVRVEAVGSRGLGTCDQEKNCTGRWLKMASKPLSKVAAVGERD